MTLFRAIYQNESGKLRKACDADLADFARNSPDAYSVFCEVHRSVRREINRALLTGERPYRIHHIAERVGPVASEVLDK